MVLLLAPLTVVGREMMDKPLEFQVGDRVKLEGVIVSFGKNALGELTAYVHNSFGERCTEAHYPNELQLVERPKKKIEELEAENKKFRGELKRASSVLDGIKYSLCASVYTLTDDEFEKVFYVRDQIDIALATSKTLYEKVSESGEI